MSRPLGVTLIACFFLVAGLYYCNIGIRMWLDRGGVVEPSEFRILSFMPYWMVGIGLAWVLVSWGLLGLQDWARWAAQILLGISVGLALPTMYLKNTHFRWQTIGVTAQLLLKALAVGYLFRANVMEAFLGKRAEPNHSAPPSADR